MRKVLFPLFLLFCIVFPLQISFAQSGSGTQSAMPSPTPVASQYALPYPGLLPDNPLYFIKVIRDDLVGFFISDPLRKASFYLLQSDKRLAASSSLGKELKRNDGLILTTLSKSTNYLNQAVGSLRDARQAGEDINSAASLMQDAITKHISVIYDMAGQTSGLQKNALTREQQRVIDLEKQVKQLIQK